MSGSKPYTDVLTKHIPQELHRSLDQLKSECKDVRFLETLIRFVSGGEWSSSGSTSSSSSSSAELAKDWAQKQSSFIHDVEPLRLFSASSSSQKRPHEDVGGDTGRSVKRVKVLDDAGGGENASNGIDEGEDEGEDEPLFTLHSISVTSPIRKKVDISIHTRSIKFTNPSTKVVDSKAIVPLQNIKHAFLLPTRGKQKPHYTVLLLTSDVPNMNRKAAGPSSQQRTSSSPHTTLQISFGVDATPSPSFTTTSYPNSPTQHPKGASILDSLRDFLSYLPSHALPVIEPSPEIHENAEGTSGIDAYRAAKSGTLWFLKQGILWDSKPVEFWDLQDLVSSKNGGGLRLLSATGRTCSVTLKRKIVKDEGEGDESEDSDEEDGVDTDFGMVDGKEQDGITQWVKKYGHLFGKKADAVKIDSKGKGKEIAANGHLDLSSNPMAEEESDLEDDNYATSEQEEDVSSSSEDESVEDKDEGDDEDQSDSANSGGSDVSSEASKGEDLNAEHHPLLRPGAVPRMSRAAMDAVVAMVEADFLGTTRQQTADSANEDEEDELDE
jgi:Histone chaperone Rttp106-like